MIDQVEHWSALADASASGHYAGVQAYAQNCLWEFADAAPAWTLYFGAEPQPGLRRPGGAGPARLRRRRRRPSAGARSSWCSPPSAPRRTPCSQGRSRRASSRPCWAAASGCAAAGGCPWSATSPTSATASSRPTRRTASSPSWTPAGRSAPSASSPASRCRASRTRWRGRRRSGADEAAVSILLNNTGTKLFFRTTDADTKELIAKLCPEPTDGCKVVHLRPPSALLPGECYAALADGRFERRRLDPYGGAGAEAEESPPAPEAAAKANGLRPNRNGRGLDE